MCRKDHTAIVVAAGRGHRMNSDVPKQFMLLGDKPVIYYPLKAIEDSFIDDIVIVTGSDMVGYCRTEIVEKYGFLKVRAVVPGGEERCDSVYNGIKAAPDADYLYIQDAARPNLTQDILKRGRDCVIRYGACAAGMPVKDTIKIADDEGFVESTPERKYVWQIQTPQIFKASLIRRAYEKLMEDGTDRSLVTDDAMAVEMMTGEKVKLFEGSYENIKITTPDDLKMAEYLFGRNL